MENVLTATNHHNTLAAHSIVNVDIKQEKEESIDAINCKPDPIVLAEKSHENGHIGLNEVTKNEPNYVNDEHLKDVDAKLDQSNQVKEEDDDDESGGKEVEEDIEDEDVPQSCEQFFDFAVICSFFQQFGAQLGFTYSIETLKGLLEETKGKNINILWNTSPVTF